MTIRTHAIPSAAVISVLMLAVGCNDAPGHAIPNRTSGTTSTTTTNTVSSTAQAESSSLSNLNSCDLLDRAMQGKDFPPGIRDDIGSDNSCQTNKKQEASYSLTILTDAPMEDWPIDPTNSHEGSINKRDAIQEKKENPPGCAIAMKVSDDSFVYVMVTRMNGTPSDSCELITNLAEKVEPMLPDGE